MESSALSELLPHDIPPSENRKHYPALDGIRALAALLVVFEHYLSYDRIPYLRWGWVGVDIFFVLSGFLITGILFDSIHRPRRASTFYIRRALRIFPLYYAVLGVIIAAAAVHHLPWKMKYAWLLYVGNYVTWFKWSYIYFQPFGISLGHFWTLSVEEQFYLLWPWVVFKVADRTKLLRLCLVVIIVLPFVRLAADLLLPATLIANEVVYRSTFFRADALLIGAYGALRLRGSNVDTLSAAARRGWPILLVLFFGLWSAAHFIFHTSNVKLVTSWWVSSFGYSLIELGALCLILISLQPGSFPYRIFTKRPLSAFGRVSYGFYVFHYLPVMWVQLSMAALASHLHLAKHVLWRQLLLDIPFVIVTFGALSFLSFRFFESPFLRLKARLAP